MLDSLKRIFSHESSGKVAKKRLQMVLIQDRASVSPEVMEKLRDDIIQVISKYMIIDKTDMEISLEEAALGIHDALRYTFCIDDAEYTASVNEIMRAIVDHGCAVYRFKNFWGNTGYKGINAQLQMPDGQIFELQLHTQDSYDAKEVKTHALYEIVRSEEASEEERETAAAEMLAVFTQVVPPDGAVDISWPENPVQ